MGLDDHGRNGKKGRLFNLSASVYHYVLVCIYIPSVTRTQMLVLCFRVSQCNTQKITEGGQTNKWTDIQTDRPATIENRICISTCCEWQNMMFKDLSEIIAMER